MSPDSCSWFQLKDTKEDNTASVVLHLQQTTEFTVTSHPNPLNLELVF